MRKFLTVEQLVASYWQKLARSIERPPIRKGRAAAPHRRRNSRGLRGRIQERVAA
jgi:hypothetical protein